MSMPDANPISAPATLDWGRTRYEEARAKQEDQVAKRISGEVGDALFFTEHEPVSPSARAAMPGNISFGTTNSSRLQESKSSPQIAAATSLITVPDKLSDTQSFHWIVGATCTPIYVSSSK